VPQSGARYPRRVRRLAALVAIAATSAACGASGPSTRPEPVVFGVSGGNLAPYQVTIGPNGQIGYTGHPKPWRRRLSRARAAALSRLVRQGFAGGLTSRQCPGTNPDFAAGFIRASGRTITVHGSCEPGFTKLWDMLARAVFLRVG
jgi:hypothetical protein